ncbi:prepilin peptidase [Arthrobacter sp. H14]|uniref:prepilin peptidase n=1 Tax=Arthrobacter sp. H14 TaxID=1312959 RepID=UPI0004B20D98|nr:A24 family peptidase [Arthrobacter sp. H14]
MVWRLSDLWQNSIASFILVLLAVGYFLVIAVRLTRIDLREHRLPNKIVFPAYPVAAVLLGVASALMGDWWGLLRMILAAAALWVFYFALRWVYPPGMGYGDVKLAGVLGIYLGYLSWGHALLGSAAAFVLAGITGTILLLTHKGNLKTRIPFGPFMILGTALVMAFVPVPEFTATPTIQ